MKKTVSICTVAMNRTDHLLATTAENSKSTLHAEHIILDYGSDISVKRKDLPEDQRIRLFRCEAPSGWWLTHAYNLAFSLTSGDYILKLDADCSITDDLTAALTLFEKKNYPDLMCNRLTLQDYHLDDGLFQTTGLFMLSRTILDKLNGFNPYLKGWGWEEIDLFSRAFIAGATITKFPVNNSISEIKHSAFRRIEKPSGKHFMGRISSEALIKASNIKNCILATECTHQSIVWPSLNEYREIWKVKQQPPVINISYKKILGDRPYKRMVKKMFKELASNSTEGLVMLKIAGKLTKIIPHSFMEKKLMEQNLL